MNIKYCFLNIIFLNDLYIAGVVLSQYLLNHIKKYLIVLVYIGNLVKIKIVKKCLYMKSAKIKVLEKNTNYELYHIK